MHNLYIAEIYRRGAIFFRGNSLLQSQLLKKTT